MNQIKNIFKFLKELKENNSRDWMQANKPEYLQQKQAFVELVQNTIEGLSGFDHSVAELVPKDCIFRINRDIRFSKDKTLYKSHFGAYMAAGGRKSMLPGYYLHLEPGNKSFLAAGLYRPGSDLLHQVRQEIDYNGQDLLSIVEKSSWKKEFGRLEGERLTKAPKGYSMDHELLEYLQLKSFMAVLHLKDPEVISTDFQKHAIKKFKRMYPLVNFLNTAIS